MTNIAVSIMGMLLGAKVDLRALVANLSPTTQISRRLAHKLGMTQFKPVYVTDNLGDGDECLKWEISTTPLVFSSITPIEQKSIVSYPIINGNKNDAWWEMIIGQDSWKQDYKIYNLGIRAEEDATHGPGYDDDGGYFIGHNIRLCTPTEVPKNEFYEYPCYGSDVVSRIAIQKAKRLLVAEFVDREGIFQFSELPEELEAQIEHSVPTNEVMFAVLQSCPVEIIDSFPESTLLGLKMDLPFSKEDFEVSMRVGGGKLSLSMEDITKVVDKFTKPTSDTEKEVKGEMDEVIWLV
jgi:hypothetical protein